MTNGGGAGYRRPMRLAGKAATASVPPAPCLRAFETEIDFILSSLRRQGVGPTDAEDLAQEIFVIMWRRWTEYDDGRPLRPWIAGIAYKVAARYRSRSRRFLPRGLLEVPDPRPGQDDQLASARARVLLDLALARLTASQRALVVMHDLEGAPIRDIAALQGVPLFTAYTRLRAGRKNLARAMVALQAQRGRSGSAVPLARSLGSAASWLAVTGALAALALLAAAWPRASRPEGQRAGAGPIARWTFDEPHASTRARDLSGNGHDCQLRDGGPGGDPGEAWTAGVRGGALALDGRHWLECPDFDRQGRLTTGLTIALWMRAESGAGRQVLVTRQLGATGDRRFSLRLQDGSLELLSHVWQRLLRRPYPRPPGVWAHVAAVRDRAGTRLYVDGVLAGHNTQTNPLALGGAGTPLLIGGQINGPEAAGRAQDLFRGAIDELAIYDRPLTTEEIRTLAAR
jgi:RNA polymerase sigma-70 factor (ECF subfamily)